MLQSYSSYHLTTCWKTVQQCNMTCADSQKLKNSDSQVALAGDTAGSGLSESVKTFTEDSTPTGNVVMTEVLPSDAQGAPQSNNSNTDIKIKNSDIRDKNNVSDLQKLT